MKGTLYFLVLLSLISTSCAEKSPEVIAKILVNDTKFGMRVIDDAISCGDSILDPLEKESVGFTRIYGRNSFWIAEVLAANRSEASRQLLEELFGREEPLQKLVAAIGLASHGFFPAENDDVSYLVQTVFDPPGEIERNLALIAMGESGCELFLPTLHHVVGDLSCTYWTHAYACEAIGMIGSPRSVNVLREALINPAFGAIPSALRASVALCDAEAISLSIDRISPDLKGRNSGYIVDELQEITHQNFGYDGRRWRLWWEAEGRTRALPDCAQATATQSFSE